ncbi:MAG TPA: rhodanese-like domain-containing protein [Acidimicrobiales bacterium]|nr:rhodanese-like domain-containing protein [Acidimicrobiales bacterium]
MFRSANRAKVQRLMDGGAQVIEVLEARQYRQAHLPGAIHIPAWKMSRSRAAALDSKRPIVVYCYDNL